MEHDTKQFQLIRGQRFVQVLSEESTYVDLERNIIRGFPEAEKRQFATDPVHTSQLEIVPYRKSGQLLTKAVMNSDGKAYDTHILFTEADFPQDEEEEQEGDVIRFRGADGNEYTVHAIPLPRVNVKVRCNCLDFYYRFSTWNHNDGSLFGKKPPSYTRKTKTHPPVNPMQVPGMCKHIISMMEAINEAGLVSR